MVHYVRRVQCTDYGSPSSALSLAVSATAVINLVKLYVSVRYEHLVRFTVLVCTRTCGLAKRYYYTNMSAYMYVWYIRTSMVHVVVHVKCSTLCGASSVCWGRAALV